MESIMQFRLLDGVLKKGLQMVVGNHAHQVQIVFHIGLSKILGENGGKMVQVLARLKGEPVGSMDMEL